jgi:Arc/MetJ-type ribon-helix-helix transcriptional regulator
MDMGRTQLNIRLDEEQKIDWETHAEETDRYRSVSDLVRQAVFNQIVRDRDGGSEGESPSHTPNGRIDEALTEITEVKTRLEDLEQATADVRRAVKANQDRTDLESEVYALLPTTDPSSEAWNTLPQGDREKAHYTPEQVAEALDIDGRLAREGCQSLYEDVGHVRITKVDGETAYWKESESL